MDCSFLEGAVMFLGEDRVPFVGPYVRRHVWMEWRFGMYVPTCSV